MHVATYDQAREYLARALPWPQQGEPEAFVNVHWTYQRNGYTKPAWGGRAVRTVDEAIRAIQFAQKSPTTRDIYACLSTQRRAEERTSANGWKYQAAIRGQDNAVSIKALFLDLDVKGTDKNSYANIGDAVAALGKFVGDVALPAPSMVVSSGGGLHVYWLLARALHPDEWQPLAHALAEATKKHGLRCDTQCTIDCARVLRIPDTLNRKSDPPRPVRLAGKRLDFDYSVERIADALKPYHTMAPPALRPRPPLPGQSDLVGGIDVVGQSAPVDLDMVAHECAFVREALATGGKDYTNPLWNLTTLLAVFTAGGRADAHRLGNQHPGYTAESTDQLFDRKERGHQEKGIGWPSCRTISASGCVACQACKHFAAGKSPLNFGSRQGQNDIQVNPPGAPVGYLPGNPHASVAAGNVRQDDLPNYFLREPSGVIVKLTTSQDGTTNKIPISPYPMTDPWLQSRPWILHFHTVTEQGKRAQIELPLEVVGSDSMRKVLQGQGLMLHGADTKNATEFFVSWIEKLQKSKDAVVSSAPFGWNLIGVTGRLEGFCYGGSVWMPNGSRPAANPDPITARQYAPTGDIAPWMAAAEMVTCQGRPALDAIIASAFAAPLVRFTGQAGLLMSTYSTESGIGKSTALKVALSVWGDPIKAMQGLSDTQNAVVNKIGEIRNLPLYWDELKTEDDTKRFVNLAFQLSLGKEKSRMTQAVQQRDVGTWQTILVSASNESLLDFVIQRTKMTTAGLYRVFEYAVPPGGAQGLIDPADAQRFVARLHDNYGQVGLAYAKFLGGDFARVDTEVGDHLKQIIKEVGSTPDERYWVALVTCICMGAKYSNELGFTSIDEEKLRGFMLGVFRAMRGERTKQPVDMKDVLNVSNILAQYVNAMRRRHTLYTNKIHRGYGRPHPGQIKIVGDVSHLEGVYVHVGKEDKMLRCSSTSISDWLVDKGYSRHVFMKALADKFGMQVVRGRIAAGTEFAGMAEHLIEIPLAGTPEANFIDEA